MALIVDSTGKPFADLPAGGRARADSGLGGTVLALPPYTNQYPYEASGYNSPEMGNWYPWIRSPDSEINLFRDQMVARSRDLARNDGWANGGITRILDNTVGAHMRLSANPDWQFLRIFNKGFDAVWADEYRKAVEALWRAYSEDIGHWNDVSRELTVSQQLRLAKRHKLVDGDSLVVAYWMPERIGRGAARYATAFLLVDPDRLSNPYQMIDTRYLRGGVEVDDYSVPIAYHIRKAEQNDWYNAVESMTWERIEREDPDGWRRVIHDFERDRANQHRGIGIFTPVLKHAKMLARYYGVELQAATVATIFGTYVTSPYDPAMIEAAMDSAGDGELGFYQELRADWAKERPAMLNNVRVPTLAPGEEIKQVAAAHPHTGFEEFAHEMLRSIAAALGVSAEQITQDWSKTNYSSARAALLESWKTLSRRSTEFKVGTATPMYACWLREAMENGDLDDVLPRNAPDFVDAATAYSRCDWLGVARGWVDPTKEAAGSIMRMDGGLSTLKKEAAEQGLDWEEVIAQRAIEVAAFKAAGLPLPDWAGEVAAAEAAKPDEAPQPR
jgi:lambda family phage portal protein